MLRELKINRFKLLRDVELYLHNGFNVFTGETGSGKSLVLGALGFLFGAKGGDELFAKGEEIVHVTAEFQIKPGTVTHSELVKEGLIELDEENVSLERIKDRDGKSRIFIGGRRANLPVVKILRDNLVDFLKQHEVSRLTERSAIDVLDTLGDSSHKQIIESVRNRYSEWNSLSRDLTDKQRILHDLNQRRDLMEFQWKELNEVNLAIGELDKLNTEHQLLASSSDLRESAYRAIELLNPDTDESGAQDLIAQAIEQIKPLADIDTEIAVLLKELSSAEESIRTITRELSFKADSIEDDPVRLAAVEERISLIEKLKRKYRCEFDNLISLREKLRSDLEEIQFSDSNLAKLEKDVARAKELWSEEASRLSKSRKKLAKKIEKELLEHLADLQLENARVAFDFQNRNPDSLSADGIDNVELLLSTNPAEEMRSLKVIASGGEATRISLALKSLWAEYEGIPILILDEGDIGIGGETAYKVAEKFKELSKSHQLIIVSHLAQVAAIADRHFLVEKTESKKGVAISVCEVSGKSRIEELARMMGGSRDKVSTMSLAEKLLNGGKSTRRDSRTNT